MEFMNLFTLLEIVFFIILFTLLFYVIKNLNDFKKKLNSFIKSMRVVNDNLIEIYNSLESSNTNETQFTEEEIICGNCIHRTAYLEDGKVFGFYYVCEKDRNKKNYSDTCVFFKHDIQK